MTKYISVDELKKKVRRTHYYLTPKMIDEMPSADVVEVVRCKDCKKYKPYAYPYPCGECGNCSYDVPAKIVKEDGYCDEGERKDDNE